MIGHQFKFIINDGQSYIASSRYGTIRDSSGNVNNYYDHRKIRPEKRFAKKNYIPHAARADLEFNNEIVEEAPNSFKYLQFDNAMDHFEEPKKAAVPHKPLQTQ